MLPTLTIDLDAVAANFHTLRAMHGAPVAAVVKADAYGMGAAAVAARLLCEGAREFFVAFPEEGVALRPVLGAAARIYVLNGLPPERGRAMEYVAHGLIPVLADPGQVATWRAAARRLGRRLPAAVQIDTGMARLGLDAAGVAALAHDPAALEGLELRYWLSHLANAELAGHPGNAAQLARLRAALARLPAAPVSLANSSGIFLGPAFRSDLARPGVALYGVNPQPGALNPLRPALRLTATVLQLREIPAGAEVGYNNTFTASRPTRVATAGIGYADGLHRALSNRAAAAFDGTLVPLIGRVSMDLATFDVTDQPAIGPGSELELIGPALPPEAAAAAAGTNAYEILTSIGARVRRRHLGR